MVVGGSASGNGNDCRPRTRKNRWGEVGSVRTGKYADVEEVDIEGDGEGLTIPSYYPIYIDISGNEDDLLGGRGHPCASDRI